MKKLSIKDRTAFLEKVNKESAQNINLCLQCGKCAAGCPVASEMDITPSRLIHAIRLGQEDLVKNSKTLWLCASCETCTTRCPHDIDIAGAIDAARRFVFAEGCACETGDVGAFHKSFLESIRMFGRTYELGMIGMLKLRTLKFTQDMGLGIKMLLKGKLEFFPEFSDAANTRRLFDKVKEVENNEK